MKTDYLSVALAAGCFLCASGTHSQTNSPGVETRVNAILHQMTLEEKLDYIGGPQAGLLNRYHASGFPKSTERMGRWVLIKVVSLGRQVALVTRPASRSRPVGTWT